MTERNKIIAEVLTVFLLFAGILWTTKLFPGFSTWQEEAFGRSIITTFAGMILIPIIFMWFTASESMDSVLSKKSLQKALRIGGKSLSVMMPVTFLSFPVVQMLGFNFLSWPGALIIGGWHLAAIPVLCRIFHQEPQEGNTLPSNQNLGILAALFAAGIAVTYVLHAIHPTAARIFIALVFIGLAEEFIFRGYIQTRLNQVFDKPWSVFGFSFGWGIIAASLLFGLMHVLSPGNPGHWAWGFWTFFGGFCFGVIREKSGTFVASGLVHGIIMIFPVLFS